ncbi:MAG: type I methionyl aminopeptidase [Candidatus Levyibacteriota bacterium]|jgi:methionyl aminopeptidase
MIKIKTPQEIKIMQRGGQMLAETLRDVCANVRPGISEIELDALANKLIQEKGGEPGFKKVEGYHHATCISTNAVVVHGIPSPYVLKEGDIIGIDCGVFYKGFHTDMSETVRVGSQKPDAIDKFLKVGKQALEAGIRQAKLGNHVGDISKAIQDIVELRNGYSVVRSLVGHGVGRELHEDPEIPGYLQGKIERTPYLKEGMVIAIEVIYNMGGPDLAFANNDGWTLKTKDNSLAGLFERTLAITKNGPLIITE